MNYERQLSGEGVLVDDVLPIEAARRRKRILIVAIVGVVLIAIVAIWSARHKQAAEAAAAGAVRAAPNVTIVTARPTSVADGVTGTGAIAARRDMPVGIVGEGGSVVRVLVEPGSWVKAGQALATIDRSVQREATASLAAQVGVARADAKLAEANLTRARALVGNGFISKADLETRIANRDAAAARLKVAGAQLDQSRASLARLDVRAPAAGLVLTRDVEPGQVVSGGSGTLFRIAKDGEMEMRLALGADDLAGIAPGARAIVKPVGSDQSVEGRVWQVAPVVDPQTRQGLVRILLGYHPSLRPGAFAAATVARSSVSGILLPESAVQSDQKGNFVYVVGTDNRVRRRPIVTGPVSDAGIAVVRGLRGGEAVVATAGGFLAPGDIVRPVRAGGR